jgi:hypothetical protein
MTYKVFKQELNVKGTFKPDEYVLKVESRGYLNKKKVATRATVTNTNTGHIDPYDSLQGACDKLDLSNIYPQVVWVINKEGEYHQGIYKILRVGIVFEKNTEPNLDFGGKPVSTSIYLYYNMG